MLNSIHRSFHLTSRHQIVLRLCSPSASRTIMSSSPHSPIPKTHTASLDSLNDYEEQFPPLTGGSKTKKFYLGSTNPSTPCQSSQLQNWTSGKDALSLQRNLGCKNRRRRRASRFLQEESNGTTFEVRNHRNSGFKSRDQSPQRIKDPPPFDICSSVLERNDTSIKDWILADETNRETVEVSNKHKVIRPGMVLLKDFLTPDIQVDIVKTCRELGVKPTGFYQPGYSVGSKLHLQMMCLGRNWDPQTKYRKNTDIDSKAPEIPVTFNVLVEKAIREAHALIDRESGTEDAERILPVMSPDICIVNFYSETGRLGLHQDRDESEESIARGLPIVSFSIGDSAEFLYGEKRYVEEAQGVILESGDVLIFGGESRMIFHGVKSIIPNSAPMSLLNESKLRTGRLNLTFRHF
ncbi:unnamed protein product [Arabidopsis thaliana]|uniref:DNA N(6)-methyladenine demethylase n=1 Tax=Arabidopsis thaliana TaxID=3702 RepID=A0A5S9Y2R1_ARATH|nr:unnamed protein product [Arabidopsis thaliana]